jgi:CRP-like cAMP-binding protein
METATAGKLRVEDIPLFAGLPKDQRRELERRVRIASFPAGATILKEGEHNPGRLYIVLDGEASVCNKGRSLSTGRDAGYEIAVRGKNEVFGEISFLDGLPAASSVVAKTPLTLAILDCTTCDVTPALQRLRAAIIGAMRGQLAADLRESIAERMGAVEHELDFSRYKTAVGRIVVTTLSLLSFYTLLLSALPKFERALEVNFAISPFIISFFALVLGPVILRSGFPPAFFGLQLQNWKSALEFSVLASLAFIGAGVALKWFLIHTAPGFSHLSIFSFADLRANNEQIMMSPLYWTAVALYLVLTPIQEFVARCCVQAPLQAFVPGTDFRRQLWAILVSNLVFAAAHSHISFAFALAAFIPGIFWGYVFARTNSLLAASISHFIIGGAGIFLFGIEEFIAAATR